MSVLSIECDKFEQILVVAALKYLNIFTLTPGAITK